MNLTAIQTNPDLLQKADKPDLNMARIDETARDFEALFMTEMMKPMFEGIKPDDTFGGGKGEEIFSGMMLDEYGKTMAAQGTLGIADQVKQQLIEMQSKSHRPEVAQNMHNQLEDIAAGLTGVENDVE
jgi:Rod binding domain-containing protein